MRIKDLKKKYTNSKPVPIAPEVFLSIRDTKKLSKILGIDYGRLLFHLGLLNKKPERGRYKEFTIAKKSGGVRNVSAPNRTILFVQRQLAEVLAKIYKPPKAAHGFINLAVSADGSPDIRKTIVSNAKQHKKKAVILNIDLKDFFPSINSRRVYSIFRKQPFNFDKKIAAFITEICIHDKNRNLPQGAATSPIISNMVCHRLDKRLTLLASDNRITYTRYADDLTFSTNNPGFADDLLKTIYQIIIEEGFVVNEKKVRSQTNREKQEVTGLIVNKKVNVERKYIRRIRAMLHNLETKGYTYCQKKLADAYRKKHFARTSPDFMDVLAGMIDFVGQVRGKNRGQDEYDMYNKLRIRFLQFSRAEGTAEKHAEIKNDILPEKPDENRKLEHSGKYNLMDILPSIFGDEDS